MSVDLTAYIKGAKVWIPHEEQGWETAVIVENFEDTRPQLLVQTDGSEETKILHVETIALLPPLCHPQDWQLDTKDNLTSLAVVHEATVSNVLRLRFEQRCVYNYCGIIMVAVNPYVKQPEDYSDQIVKYHEETTNQLEPHIFSVAEKACTNFKRENKDQSIIFSGESGSGKTENANLTILYLSTDVKTIKIKEKLLASLTVLQAFGHAKTAKNENSSRFGKFFELQYNDDFNIVGANLKTYLLHRSRVVSQPTGEQSFHIFYQMKSAHENLPSLQLHERKFAYLDPGNPLGTNETNNLESFTKTTDALNILEFSSKHQHEIWTILAAILHLGNISFKRLGGPGNSENTDSCLIANLHSLKSLVKLFGLDQQATPPLRKWLCNKRTLFHQDEIRQPMTVELATRNRDCLARFLYKQLFNFIVSQINASLRSPCNVQSFIGVLDMYGFENLATNSFEQFCINYANEKIQQHCVQMIFKNEQEEYVREKIGWNFNQFRDNSLCIELIEGRGGIIDIVDEETKKYVQATKDINLSWVYQLHANCVRSQYFSAWQEGSADFAIHHFITTVRYDPKTFVEKNRDSAITELLEVLKDSRNDVLHKLVLDEYTRLASAQERRKTYVYTFNRTKSNKKSVLFGFRNSLAALTETLRSTRPNFVVCVKSNAVKKAWQFDPMCVLEQLHAFNITEIIRMSAEGFFKQQLYIDFFRRYRCLLPFESNEQTPERLMQNCLRIVQISTGARFGTTKIFLREEDINQLEELLNRKQVEACITIQRVYRGHLEIQRYWRLRRATLYFQNNVRKRMKEIHNRRRRQIRAVTVIQKYARGYRVRKWYRKLVRGYTSFRLYARVRIVVILTRDVQMVMVNACARAIQSGYRGYVARRRYVQMRRSAIMIQAWFRGCLTRKIAKKLKEDRRKQNNLEIKLDNLHVKINCLIEKHLSPDELEQMHQITDDAQSTQAKNKALNRVLFEKIETLKILRGKPQNTPPERASQISEEAEQKTPRKNEEKICVLPVIEEIKDVSEEEVAQCDVTNVCEVSTPPEEVSQVTLEKQEEETCEAAEITVYSEESDTENAEVAAQFDAIEAQQASALAYQMTPPKVIHKEKQKICALPEIDVNLDETVDEIVYCTTVSAREVFKSVLDEEDVRHSYKSLLDAYDKFDRNSEEIRHTLKLGDFQLMKHKMSNRNSEITIRKIDKPLPKKVKSCTKFSLDLSSQTNKKSDDLADQQDDLTENVLILKEKKKRLGMCQFDLNNTFSIIFDLVIDKQVAIIKKFNPVMPAIILFMCIRYIDSVNNNAAFASIIGNYKKTVEDLVKNFNTLEMAVLWLANTHQLLNYLKQFSKIGSSGWEQHHLQNTERQIEYQLRNLDCSLFYSYLCSNADWLFRKAQQIMQMRVSELVAPAILENDHTIDDVTFAQADPGEAQRLYYSNRLYLLLKHFTMVYTACIECGLSRNVIIQLFEQIFHFINSIALNNLLCRKEFCNNQKGIQIRCNIRTIETWAANRQLSRATLSLTPIKEATQLINLLPCTSSTLEKTIQTGHFKKLNFNQILKIISSYKPLSDDGTFEVNQQVIVQRMQLKILNNEILDNMEVSDHSRRHVVSLPFEHSPIHFDEIEIPAVYDIDKYIELI